MYFVGLSRKNTYFEIFWGSWVEKGESWSTKALLREVQRHPFKNLITHIDFWELSDTENQTFRVPLEVTGESPGVKNGGVLQMVVRDIPVVCMPSDIPKLIKVDSSMLEIGDSYRIKDIKLPEKVTLGTQENYAVISVVGRAKEEIEESVMEESEGESEQEEVKEEAIPQEEKKDGD